MNELKITKGIFSVGGVASDRVYADGLMVAAVDGVGWEEARENAALIAEAFNIANETCLTPRQLLEQRGVLMSIAKRFRHELRIDIKHYERSGMTGDARQASFLHSYVDGCITKVESGNV